MPFLQFLSRPGSFLKFVRMWKWLKYSTVDTVLCLCICLCLGHSFHFPALPQISCVWPWASYYNPCGLESPSCKPVIILPHPLWLCLYIQLAPWGTASQFLFIWQIVLSTTWSWTWLCHPDTAAWSVFLYPTKRVTGSHSELALPCSESKMQVCWREREANSCLDLSRFLILKG